MMQTFASKLKICALQEFLLAYDSKPARIASDRWWAAVILAQTFIITYFNMLDPIPDHVQLAITAQGAGALLVTYSLMQNELQDVFLFSARPELW